MLRDEPDAKLEQPVQTAAKSNTGAVVTCTEVDDVFDGIEKEIR